MVVGSDVKYEKLATSYSTSAPYSFTASTSKTNYYPVFMGLYSNNAGSTMMNPEGGIDCSLGNLGFMGYTNGNPHWVSYAVCWLKKDIMYKWIKA